MDTDSRHVIDLEGIRTDGWFEQLGEDIPDFDQLCQVVGRRFVAFSFIASVRITSIAYDAQAPHSSLVDFTIGDSDEGQRMTLADLRERLGSALLSADDPGPELPDEPSAEDIRRYVGRRYLLLAPIFGIRLDSLEIGGDQEPSLRLDLGHSTETISVDGLRDVLHNAIRSELARARPNQPFSIDFKKVPVAEEANMRGDFDETIALLGAWPGPLSMFLRTPQGQALGVPERTKLVRALGALGEAYLRSGQGEWAEDVLRLGIQFGQELDASGPLFALLGQSRVETGRYGEAIGLLRRALSLGTDRRMVLADLARCFAERGRNVAAIACLDEARQLGIEGPEAETLRSQVLEALGEPYERFRRYMDG
ncbi:MAG: tetratricopeptide repeat protein [Myxococcales bacterium]